ncbi:MAG: hypothetical protein M1831_006039 [Alyxoria varia]|nr:MAG: hypothetical protein M1831_006039 [Alyxoria varia]
MKWWWVGFMTFTQAFKLYFNHKLHVWYRPEVKNTTIGRAPTTSERVLESWFSDYLTKAAHSYQEPLEITYTPPEDPDIPSTSSRRTRVLLSDAAESQSEGRKKLGIHITSPAFFNRLVQYRSMLTGLESETQDPSEENRTARISDPAQLYLLFTEGRKNKSSRTTIDSKSVSLTTWTLIRALRYFNTDRPTVAASYPIKRGEDTSTDSSDDANMSATPRPNHDAQCDKVESQTKETTDKETDSTLSLSFLDFMVATSAPIHSAGETDSQTEIFAAVKVISAARFALGNEFLLDIYPWLGAMFVLALVVWTAWPWFYSVLRLQT